MNDKYIFVIDTDQYAGNFERDMCAYLTGEIGECEVGEERRDDFINEVGEDILNLMDKIIEQKPDEHGTHRPCYIYPTPGFFNNGVGGEFKDGEEDAAQKHFVKSCLHFANKEKSQVSKDEYLKDAKEQFIKCHAYLSVAIYFYEKPAPDIIDMMKDRAHKFVALPDKYSGEVKGINILGFRVVKEMLTTEEMEV